MKVKFVYHSAYENKMLQLSKIGSLPFVPPEGFEIVYGKTPYTVESVCWIVAEKHLEIQLITTDWGDDKDGFEEEFKLLRLFGWTKSGENQIDR